MGALILLLFLLLVVVVVTVILVVDGLSGGEVADKKHLVCVLIVLTIVFDYAGTFSSFPV